MPEISYPEFIDVKNRVDDLERKMAYLLNHLQIREDQIPQDAHVSAGVMELINRGKKIKAIKLHMKETGVSLREANYIINSLMI